MPQPQFHEGQLIKVPCAITAGPFSDEPIITLESVNGPISGFVSNEELVKDREGKTYVKCVVHAIYPDSIEVWIKGSFFTTNGLAAVPRGRVAAA